MGLLLSAGRSLTVVLTFIVWDMDGKEKENSSDKEIKTKIQRDTCIQCA